MMSKQKHYQSYLLRLWLTANEKGSVWRASLENRHTGERLTFATLERLSAFLEDQCTQDPDRDERSFA
jgi:hypothetical protein